MPSQSFRVKNSLEVGAGVTITSGGNITAGILTATSFVGGGSQLTGVIASSGTATYASVSGVSSSVVGGGVSATSLSVVGVSTFDGAIKVRNGYNLNIGDNNDLRIYNDGTDSRIEETGSGSLYISGSDINIQQHSTNKNFARFVGNAAELYYNDNKKFSTSGVGVTITGTLISDNAGIGTTNPVTPLQVERYGVKTGFGTFSASVGVTTDIDTFTISTTDFKTSEYTLHFTNGDNIQSQKVLVMQNGTTAYSQEYAIMFEPNQIVSVGATVSSGSCKLQVTPETGISGLTTYRITRQTML